MPSGLTAHSNDGVFYVKRFCHVGHAGFRSEVIGETMVDVYVLRTKVPAWDFSMYALTLYMRREGMRRVLSSSAVL